MKRYKEDSSQRTNSQNKSSRDSLPYARRSIGIRELSNATSKIVQEVVELKIPIIISNNGVPVAQLMPLRENLLDQLKDLGMLARSSTASIDQIKLTPTGRTSVDAVNALLSDRDE